MVHKLSVRWAEYMVSNGADKDQAEVYAYGLECLLNELLSDILLLLTAIGMGRVRQMICWIILFNIFRIHFGGFHAKTSLGCLAGSTLIGVLCVVFYPVFYTGYTALLVILCINNMIVWTIAPVLHPNHPFSDNRRKDVRKRARFLSVFFSALTLIMYNYQPGIAALMCATFTCACVLSAAGRILN